MKEEVGSSVDAPFGQFVLLLRGFSIKILSWRAVRTTAPAIQMSAFFIPSQGSPVNNSSLVATAFFCFALPLRNGQVQWARG